MKPKIFRFKYQFNLYCIGVKIVCENKNTAYSVISATGVVNGKTESWKLNKGIEIIKFIKQCVSDEEFFDWLEESIQKEVTND